jgi:pimeloyl-ACP methyl ester carboxylesterase
VVAGIRRRTGRATGETPQGPAGRQVWDGGGVELRVVRGDGAGPGLVLVHGLGANAGVWDGWRPLLAGRRWAAVDLPGHGGSAPLERYSFGALAAAVAPVVEDGDVVLGHSLGGVVALALGSGWFGPRPGTVVGLGIKVAWTDAELDRARAVVERPAKDFATRDEAVARFLRVSGLTGGPAVDAGVRPVGGRWEVALDQRAFGVGAPDLPGLLAACRARVVLARGEHDPMVTAEQLGPGAVTLPGLGHNAHAEDPAAVAALLP